MLKIFKKKYAKANNLDDYKNLPQNEREIFGFWYLEPHSYLMGGGDFDGYWEKNYPIQYRVREFILDCSIKISVWKHWWYDNVKCRIFPKNEWARKVIPNTYRDKDTIIEDILIAAVIDFVENENNRETFRHPENDHLRKVWIELTDIYTFFKVDLPRMQAAHECVMEKWIESTRPDELSGKTARERVRSILSVANKPSKKSRHFFLKSQIMQSDIDDQIASYLKRLIDIRLYLWE